MDLGDSHSINNIVEKYKPDYFINCAANSFVGTSWDCPEQHFEYNCLGVLRQLEAIRKHSPSTRYVNFGSSEEFGDVVTVPQNETHPARARSPYGASKIAARQIIKVYRESYDLFAIQCWCFNYESERRGCEFVTRKITKAVARIKRAIDNEEAYDLLELGNINSQRDWSYCPDFVDGVWKMLNQQQPREYVLSSNETHTIREFVELAFEAAGIQGYWLGSGINEIFLQKETERVLMVINEKFYRPAEVELLLGDSTKARQELEWKPKTSFKNLVDKMVFHDIMLLDGKE
jgi:GDPmannose 4,6-dehydratase